MKKVVILLGILFSAILVSACYHSVNVAGAQISTPNRALAAKLVDPAHDYSHGALKACAEAVKANPQGTLIFGSNGSCTFVGSGGNHGLMEGVVENYNASPAKLSIRHENEQAMETYLVPAGGYLFLKLFPGNYKYDFVSMDNYDPRPALGQVTINALTQDKFSPKVGRYVDFILTYSR